MALTNIEQLLEKYLNAETSLEEERQLQQYFLQDNVAPHLQDYAAMFTYYKTAKQDTFTKPLQITPKKRNFKLVYIAASVALLISIFFGKQEYDNYNNRKKAEQIYADVSKGLLLLSKNLKKGEQAVSNLYAYENTVNKILK
jgi:hypothetical protein